MSTIETGLSPQACTEADALVTGLTAVSRHLEGELQHAATPLGLSPQAARILMRLASSGRVRMSEFARSAGCDAGNLSGTIDRLEDAGLAARDATEADRRVRYVRATPKGERLATKLRTALEAAPTSRALRDLETHERGTLLAILKRLLG